MKKKYDLMVFGEPSVQYSVKNGDMAGALLANPGIGGQDVFTAATVAAHKSLNCGLYATVASDPYENLIRQNLHIYRINTDFCTSALGFNAIEIVCDEDREAREFFYNHPASFYGDAVVCPRVNKELIDDCKMIYTSSAFTLSSPDARSLIFESFHYAHYNNVSVAFDPNVRLHRHRLPQLRETIWMLMPFIDFFSMTAASGEMRSIFGIEDPLDAALSLLEKNVQYAVIRNGGESVTYAYRSEKTGKPIFGQVGVEKLEDGYFSYSGAVFNGAFIAAILNEETPEKSVQYAVHAANQKCRRGNVLDKIFPASDK